MVRLNSKQQKILSIFLKNEQIQSSDVHAEMVKSGEDVSLITIKRGLSELTDSGFLTTSGSGRSTKYKISSLGRLATDVDTRSYCSIEPDKRYGMAGFNFDLITSFSEDIFDEEEIKTLDDATVEYEKRTKDLSSVIQKKELERLIIELSWKSSKIEGNTYTLLDTEKLILENKEAPGHDKKEAQMILNHKEAFNFVRENSAQFKTITRRNLEELHTILVKNLSVGLGFRKKLVGIVGTKYRPLDNEYQISEAVEALSMATSKMTTAYAKALLALVGIGYIQPFEDGNKRTSRLMANALLLSHSKAPLSYRSIDENEYCEAMLVFYELNSIQPFKKIFIDQYIFAAQNYTAK